MTTTTQQSLGRYGENLAAHYLTTQADGAWSVVARNWRCPDGEIDLVCREGTPESGVLVVVEVKTRSNVRAGTPHEAITPAKLERLNRLGQRYAHEHGLGQVEVRIDLIAVMRPPRGAAQLDHVRGLS